MQLSLVLFLASPSLTRDKCVNLHSYLSVQNVKVSLSTNTSYSWVFIQVLLLLFFLNKEFRTLHITSCCDFAIAALSFLSSENWNMLHFFLAFSVIEDFKKKIFAFPFTAHSLSDVYYSWYDDSRPTKHSKIRDRRIKMPFDNFKILTGECYLFDCT